MKSRQQRRAAKVKAALNTLLSDDEFQDDNLELLGTLDDYKESICAHEYHPVDDDGSLETDTEFVCANCGRVELNLQAEYY